MSIIKTVKGLLGISPYLNVLIKLKQNEDTEHERVKERSSISFMYSGHV